jgi:hypothetical protein
MAGTVSGGDLLKVIALHGKYQSAEVFRTRCCDNNPDLTPYFLIYSLALELEDSHTRRNNLHLLLLLMPLISWNYDQKTPSQ